MASTIHPVMGRQKLEPSSKAGFAQRLIAVRKARELTQVQLAQMLGTTQRNISHYETGAGYPPAPVVAELARILAVSTDELLGVNGSHTKPATKGRSNQDQDDPQTRRLWKKFRQVARLPDKDQRAVIRLINSLAKAS
jgi:transcriptional regulator with XRE-family HTH domain